MIHLLPGMGADQRMYPAPWTDLPGVRFINWPKYSGEQTLADVAQTIRRQHPIGSDDWLVGSSLGGMVAIELAKAGAVRGVILVGSAAAPAEVGTFLRALGPLIDLAPLSFIQQLTGKIPAELTRMFKDSDPAFLRAMCKAILRWDGLGESALPVHRIHGRQDFVIPCPAAGVDRVLDGGHLIAMTHPGECVDFVRQIVGA